MADCRDPECHAHGRYLRRIRRLARAVAKLRRDPMAIPVLDVNDPDQAGAGARYAAEVREWQWWRTKGAGRDERALGWERAHTTMCDKIPCREHRNPYQRSRASG